MGITSDPKGRGITVTIKYGKGYEESWVVFHGLAAEIREDIVDYFGLPRENVVNLTLSDLVVNATGVAHGVGNIAATLGGTVIASVEREPAPATPAGSDAWERAASQPAPEPPAVNPLLALIEQAPDVRSLERLWLENQDAFADPAIMTAWKGRGRALSQAR